MRLTKRKDGWYVELPVVDDGKVLTLARGILGSKLKRWKTLTSNKTMAKQQEAKIKTDLMMGKVVTERLAGPMTIKALTTGYLDDPKIQHQRIFQQKTIGSRNDFFQPLEATPCCLMSLRATLSDI